jgi:hypothetical protein
LEEKVGGRLGLMCRVRLGGRKKSRRNEIGQARFERRRK